MLPPQPALFVLAEAHPNQPHGSGFQPTILTGLINLLRSLFALVGADPANLPPRAVASRSLPTGSGHGLPPVRLVAEKDFTRSHRSPQAVAAAGNSAPSTGRRRAAHPTLASTSDGKPIPYHLHSPPTRLTLGRSQPQSPGESESRPEWQLRRRLPQPVS